MGDNEERASPQGRLLWIDALRGWTLVTIALVHFSEQFLGDLPPAAKAGYASQGGVDALVEGLLFFFVRGKGFLMFSFLFGVSFWLQMAHRGEGYWRRFLWRLTILLGLGYGHTLLYRGDILIVYAALGFPFVFFRRLPDRALWTIAALLFFGLPRVLLVALSSSPQGDEIAAAGDRDQARAVAHWEALEEGDVPRILYQNGTEGLASKTRFQVGLVGRGYQTFAMFLIGLSLARAGRLEVSEFNRSFWFRVRRNFGLATLLTPLIGFGALAALRALTGPPEAGTGMDLRSTHGMAGIAFYDIWNAVMTLFYVGLFYWLVQRGFWRRLLLSLQPIGKMALTCYVTQSVAGLLVFSGLGLGQLGKLGSAGSVGVCFLVVLVQLVACRWWLARFCYGPLEWIWRSLTQWRWAPLTRR